MGRSRFLGGTNIEKNARDLRVYMAEESGVPYQVMVSDDDTTPGYLSDKITSADASVVITPLNDGADEDLDLSVAVYVAAEIATHTSDADAHHNQSHVLATASGLGADHTVSGLTAGHVLRATGATTAAFGALQATDLAVHVLATTSGLGSQHSVSGLTAGQVLRATGSTTAAFASLQATDLPSHVLATNTALGSQHTISGATAGHVLRASGATTAAFAQLQHGDLGGVGANDHHNQSHVLASTSGLGADHTVSGLTSGQVLRATGATTAAFGSLQATDLPSHVLATNTALGSQHTISGATAGHVLRASGATTAAFAQLQHSDLGGVGANDHHNQSHVLATTSALGSDHTVSGLTAGQVLKATGATAARFIQLLHSELGSIGANDHHNQSHVLASTSGLGADHTVSGLTARQVLVATGATTALFRAIEAADLPTGATLSVSSTNSGNSHAITSSSAVSSATAVLLATDSNGRLQVQGFGVGTAATGTGVLDVATKIYINETADANVTTGLVINQGTADNGIITLKSSEVAHGMTDLWETDTYGVFAKSGNGDTPLTGTDAGGLLILGLRDADGDAGRALVLAGYLGEAAATTVPLGTTGSSGVVQITAGVKSGAGGTTVADDGNMFSVSNFGVTRWVLKGDGRTYQSSGIFVNDTANANSTIGLTINQGANDDEIISLKSSDVAHGVTDTTETDTFGVITKAVAAEGGVFLRGYTEGSQGARVSGVVTSGDTTKSTAAVAAVVIQADKKNAATFGAMGSNENLVAIRDNASTRWIVDKEGDTHRDGSDNVFDFYLDAHLARAFDMVVSPGAVIDSEFDAWVQYGRSDLIAAGILHESGFYNESRLLRLAIGAVWQEYTERQRLTQRVQELEQRLLN